MDLTERLKRITRLALGLDEDPDSLPRIDRLAIYKARVDACASDGSTVDVTPLDPRIDPAQAVRVSQPFPGAVVVVQANAIVHLGWTEGDPEKPYVEAYESGAATKIVIKATMVYLGDETGAEALVKKSEFEGHVHQISGVQAGAASVTAAVPAAITGTAQVKGK